MSVNNQDKRTRSLKENIRKYMCIYILEAVTIEIAENKKHYPTFLKLTKQIGKEHQWDNHPDAINLG